MVGSLIEGNAANITCIGREINHLSKMKLYIKHADGLPSNTHLQSEAKDIYQTLAKLTLTQCQRPIILIDWSALDEYKRHFLIRATLATYGREHCI